MRIKDFQTPAVGCRASIQRQDVRHPWNLSRTRSKRVLRSS